MFPYAYYITTDPFSGLENTLDVDTYERVSDDGVFYLSQQHTNILKYVGMLCGGGVDSSLRWNDNKEALRQAQRLISLFQYSTPFLAFAPLAYGCLISRHSVTRSACFVNSFGAWRPVKMTSMFSGMLRMSLWIFDFAMSFK